MTDIEITPKPEPVALFVRRYECPFCGSKYRKSSRAKIVEHLGRCWYDPAKHTCKTCFFSEEERPEPEVGHPGGIYCNAKNESLDYEHTPVISCPLWRDRDEDEDEPFVDAWDRGLRELGGEPR